MTSLCIYNSASFFYSRAGVDLLKVGYNILVILAPVCRKTPAQRDHRVTVHLLVFLHVIMPLLIGLRGTQVNSNNIINVIGVLGVLISAVAIIGLWDLFGGMPADRGIKVSGL